MFAEMNCKPRSVRWESGAGWAVIGGCSFFIFRHILIFRAGAIYPWGSDTLGHVLKVEYLMQELAKGQLYPDLLPAWYLGLQMMRYHPPLPYYLLAVLTAGLGNAIGAANLFIFLCAWFGGASWMLFKRWIGWWPALVGGILFVFLPDNVRVALAEGNLPRVLATAFLPLTFYFFLSSLDQHGKRWHRLGLAFGFAVIVLSHVMMAAIYAVCFVLWGAAVWLWRGTRFRSVVLTILFLIVGLAVSGWWLLPSLTGGGITSLNAEALSESQAVIPLDHYLSPGVRTGNPETIYVGAALLMVSLGAFLGGIKKDGYPSALAVVGFLGILITAPGFNPLFKALPLQNLLWPLRFLGIASFMLLLSIIWRMKAWVRKSPLLVGLILFFLFADALGSEFLINLRPARMDLIEIAGRLSRMPGWREATLDESRLGSAASYWFTSQGYREQVYGWAYQGARTASLVASLNDALVSQHEAYLIDRLNLLGVDDVVLLNILPTSAQFSEVLINAGYERIYQGDSSTLYHRPGGPRAFAAEWPGLGIGRGAPNAAYLFPQMVVGTSRNLEDYTLDELVRYQTVFLSGFEWTDQAAAEQLMIQAAHAGVRVVVDLTGVQEDVLARIPRFLDVWGEQIILGDDPVPVLGGDQGFQISPFSEGENLWYTHTPQGLDLDLLTFDYLGEVATLTGYKQYEKSRIWFVGGNLLYHAALTRDPASIQILQDLFQLPPDTPSEYSSIPLSGYLADSRGYHFSYAINNAESLLVPVAHHEGIRVKIDGRPVETYSLENLLVFDAPAGSHEVDIEVRATGIYLAGWVMTGLALVVLVGLYFWGERLVGMAFKGAEPIDEVEFLSSLWSNH